MITSIAHIGLTVSNLERSIAFYQDTLHLEYQGEMKMGGPETATLFKREGCQARVAYLKPKDSVGPLVELIQFTSCEVQNHKSDLFETSISELCFAVDDIDAETEKLKALGVKLISEPQTFDSTAYGFGKSRAVYFYDPDENILELIQPVD